MNPTLPFLLSLTAMLARAPGDRSSVMPDGSKVFAPTGWWDKTETGGLVVVDGTTDQELRSVRLGKGPHNSIISPDGTATGSKGLWTAP